MHTKRATDSLILARQGREPQTANHTSSGIKALGRESAELASLQSSSSEADHYYLHSNCFYDGNRDPEDVVSELIRGVGGYIQDAGNRKVLSGTHPVC